MNSIETRNLSKSYRLHETPLERLKTVLFPARSGSPEFHAVRDVSLAVPRGQAVGLVGQNGSGKSTLLAMIAGVIRPSEGALGVNGRVSALLELGAGFNSEFTGRENIYMNGALAGIPAADMQTRVREIEDFAEIGDFMDHPVKTYSSGMFVRLAFSAAINMNPDVLLIDEALSVGDAYFQHKCFAKLKEFRQKGITMAFVSHDLGAVKRLCDRVILLDRGRLIKDGEPDVVLDFYNALIAQKENEKAIVQSGNRQTRSGDSRARVESVGILGPDLAPGAAFRTGDKIEIRCRVHFRDSLADPTIGFMIRDRMGSDVFGTNTFHTAPLKRTVQAGEVLVASFRLPLNIGPGSYSLTVTVHAGATHLTANYDWWDKACMFQVLRGSEPYYEGGAYLPTQISITQEAAECGLPLKDDPVENNGDYGGRTH